MSIKTEKFLALYKDYETLVRMNGDVNPKDLEDSMPEDEGNRMRLCRQFRNYLSHNNDPGFIEPTDKMIKFLTDKNETLTMQEDVAKKHIKTAAASICEENEKCMDALIKMSKLKRNSIAVKRKDGTFAAYNIYSLVTAISTIRPAVKLKDVKASGKVGFCKPTDFIKDLDKEILTICTSTGDAEGKLLGTVIF